MKLSLALPKNCKYKDKLIEKYDYEELVTFMQNKKEPIHRWFYYKEGYAPELVSDLIKKFKLNSPILDPFAGTGTTLLTCKQNDIDSIGFDITPLAVFVSKVKLERDYDLDELHEKIIKLTNLRYMPPKIKWHSDIINLKQAFSKYAYNDICFFKENIIKIQDEKIRNFIMLGLLSILGQASYTIKDGGFVRIKKGKKKHLPPVRHLLKRQLKKMFKELKDQKNGDAKANIYLGDARSLELNDNSVSAVITSPPYLNNVDYTKIYTLELSLLEDNVRNLKEIRRNAIRSHIGAVYEPDEDENKNKNKIPENVKKIIDKFSNPGIPLIARGYFEDMYLSLAEMHRVLKKGVFAFIVVANAQFSDVTIDVDTTLAELAEEIGFKLEEIWVAKVRWADVYKIRKERPVRESIVILRK
ncbi:MAG: hypothetical protein CVT90_01155 [Candidatus Altiarchaeales archaeon HGW-Altiarchaeales-3]|nr:MAG: hypothetical protein CVT90_01155 [Candidatus Altiarchaeales archaeon HGW-Altiarchaeales-3]